MLIGTETGKGWKAGRLILANNSVKLSEATKVEFVSDVVLEDFRLTHKGFHIDSRLCGSTRTEIIDIVNVSTHTKEKQCF